MLSKKQVSEIQEHLEKAQNPIFFFDNDPDGLCSFLLLQRFIKRGFGIPIKSFPDMNVEHFRRVNELNADYIFILDKPVVSREFFEEVKAFNIPIVWIDHHKTDQAFVPDYVHYYNSALTKTKKKNEPVTYLCYKIANKKDDLWIAVAGCISDHFVPDFYSDFQKIYPDLSFKSKEPFDIFYRSGIGTVAKMFSFGLKDTITNVVKMMKFLSVVKTPYEVLEEGKNNHEMHYKFKQITKKYSYLIDKAKSLVSDDKILFFQYSGDLSISSDLSNELSYLFPDKVIIVVYIMGIKANISVRGNKIKNLFLKAIEGIEGATGGGHENAVGGQLKVEDIVRFRENMEKLYRKV